MHSNNLSMFNSHNNHNNHQLSDESPMNFSFSDIKTNVDKSALFDRNMMILHTDYPREYEMLERVS